MLRFIMAGLLAAGAGLAIHLPATSLPATAAGLPTGRPLVPHIVEYARGSAAKPAGGAVYCYAPLDARGQPDFAHARAVGTGRRAALLETVSLKAPSSRLFTGTRMLTAGGDAHSAAGEAFFAAPLTAEAFCTLAQTRFAARGLALNIW